MPKRPKQPVARGAPPAGKRPLFRGPTPYEGQPLAWRLSGADSGGQWPWTALQGAERDQVLARLAEFERMHLDELHRGGSSHFAPIDHLVRDAQDRLAALGKDDQDNLVSFRYGNRPRVWCIPFGNVMSVLWWDPRHEVLRVDRR